MFIQKFIRLFCVAACISKYSSGALHYFPNFHNIKNPRETDRFEGTLRRYFTRKIGFESVMRIRCTRGEIKWEFVNPRTAELFTNPRAAESFASIFHHLKLELPTRFPASNDEKYYSLWKTDMSDIELLD